MCKLLGSVCFQIDLVEPVHQLELILQDSLAATEAMAQASLWPKQKLLIIV